MRNYWLNGYANVWQRGTSVALGTSSGFTADRIYITATGTATHTVSKQTSATGLVGPDGVSRHHYFRWAISGTPDAGTVSFGTHIPGVKTFAGRYNFITFWAKADAATTAGFACSQVYGTGGSPTATVSTTGLLSFAITTSFQQFGGTFYLPALVATTPGTLGSDGNDHIFPRITLSHTQAADKIIDIQNIEMGPYGTVYDVPHPADELAQCQRFYEQLNVWTVNGVRWIDFKVPKWKVPTVASSAAGSSTGNITKDGFELTDTAGQASSITVAAELV